MVGVPGGTPSGSLRKVVGNGSMAHDLAVAVVIARGGTDMVEDRSRKTKAK